ncbi:MAG: insulinase family protein [Deltaproteobacteria bacterium]|nr:insulinase family protein [Deltaproteobacteria bacterium]
MRPLPFPLLAEERLDNSAALVVARRPGIPLVAVRLVLSVGAALDPAGGHGTAHLTAISCRRGTRRLGGLALDRAVESLGSELGSGSDEDASFFGLSAPSEHLPRLLQLVTQVVTEPAFPAGEVERLRRRELAGLRHLLDEPGAVADRALLRTVHGDHPYGHPADGTAAHLRRLSRASVAAYHRRWYGPGVATLVVVGDVPEAATLARGRRLLSRWRSAADTPPLLTPPRRAPRRVVVVDRPDLTQTQVRIGVAALPRRTPDYFAATVANAAFGGGFTSRLVQAIRVDRGLSYGVRSRFSMSRAGGMFYVSSFTRNDAAAELLEVAFAEARRFADEGPTPEELDRARAWLAGTHPLSLETHEQVAERIADLRLYGLEVAEVTGYADRVQAVTAEDCRRVARAHFPGDDGAVVAVGPARLLQKSLARFGPVEVLSPGRAV